MALTVAERFKLPHPGVYQTATAKSFVYETPVDSDELIGIEVEVEGVRQSIPEELNFWELKDDGSLRNSGTEFVTQAIPARCAPYALEQLFGGTKFSCTPRTSVHIHLNVQDFTVDQLYNLVIMYSLFEKLLYGYVGRNRAKNIFCVPILETYLVDFLMKNGWTFRWEKYTGLNLGRLRDLGTVEFRHMHGTSNVKKLVGWINLICSLKKYCLSTTTLKIRKIFVSDTEPNFADLAREVFGEYSILFKPDLFASLKDSYIEVKRLFSSDVVTKKIHGGTQVESDFCSWKGVR